MQIRKDSRFFIILQITKHKNSNDFGNSYKQI